MDEITASPATYISDEPLDIHVVHEYSPSPQTPSPEMELLTLLANLDYSDLDEISLPDLLEPVRPPEPPFLRGGHLMSFFIGNQLNTYS